MTEAVEIYEHDQEATATAVAHAQAGGVFQVRDPAEMIAQAAKTADVLKDVVKARGLVSNISGKEYLTVEAWSTLGVLVGCTARTEWTREIEDGYEAAVEVVNVNGLVIGRAEAICTRQERNWKTRDAYALKSMAQTRAMGKALRMPLGWIAVLAGYSVTPAEEMPSTAPQEASGGQASPKPTDHQPENRVDGRRPAEAATTWPVWEALMKEIGVKEPNAWLAKAVEAFYGNPSLKELTEKQRKEALAQANTAYVLLYDDGGTLEPLGVVTDERLGDAFSAAFGGIKL